MRSHRLSCDTGAGQQTDACVVARVMRCWRCAPKSDCFSSFGNGGKTSVGEGPCRPLFDGGAPVGLPALPRLPPPLPGLPRRPFFFAILACSCKDRPTLRQAACAPRPSSWSLLSFPCSHVLDRISPIFSPFFPVFCAFSPPRRDGSNEPQAGTQGRKPEQRRQKRRHSRGMNTNTF